LAPEPRKPQTGFLKFDQEMRPYFGKMKVADRTALLREVYRLCTFKKFFDSYVTTVREKARKSVPRFRKYRLWLAGVDKKLSKAMKAMQEAMDAANNYPRQDDQDGTDELKTLTVGKTLTAIVRTLNELGKAIDVVRYRQYVLAAGVHPTKRSGGEKKLVPQEPKGLEDTKLSLSEKAKQIDLWFIRYTGYILDKYHNKDGRPIQNYDQIIEHVFKFGFGLLRTPASIAKDLRRSRGKQPQQFF